MIEEQSDFPIVKRGYDRVLVDQHIQTLLDALTQARREAEELDSRNATLTEELADSHNQLNEVNKASYTGVGARIEQLLRSAEEQALSITNKAAVEAEALRERARTTTHRLTQRAEAEAASLLTETRREAEERTTRAATEAETVLTNAQNRADELVASAEREAAALRSEVSSEVHDLRTTTEHETQLQRAQAEKDSVEMRVKAEQESSALRSEAVAEAQEMRDSAATETTQLREKAKAEAEAILTRSRSEADRILSESRATAEQVHQEVAKMRHEAETEIAATRAAARAADVKAHEEARDKTTAMLTTLKTQLAEAEKHLGETLQRSERLLTDTDAVVRRRQDEARRSAEERIAAAETEASRIIENARGSAQAERAAIQRTVEKLERQKEAVTTYLDEMRGLLGAASIDAVTSRVMAQPPVSTQPVQKIIANHQKPVSTTEDIKEPVPPANSHKRHAIPTGAPNNKEANVAEPASEDDYPETAPIVRTQVRN